MFEDFDYKKALGGGGKLIKGVVKAVSPDAGAGVDEAGGGLGDILKAAGVAADAQEVERATVRRVWHCPEDAGSPGALAQRRLARGPDVYDARG